MRSNVTRIERQIAIAVILDHGKVVIGQRPAHVPLAGYWEFPGGHVDEGESLSQAAVRETREETGLIIRVGNLLAEVTVDLGDRTQQLAFFECALVERGDPTPPFRWVDCHLLPQFTFPPANRPVVAQLSQLLGSVE